MTFYFIFWEATDGHVMREIWDIKGNEINEDALCIFISSKYYVVNFQNIVFNIYSITGDMISTEIDQSKATRPHWS